MSLKRLKTGPSRRGKGEVFPGPATFGGPATAQNYRQRWLLSDIKYPWNPFFCGRAPFRTPLRKIVTLPRRLVGWCRDTPPKFPSSRCLRRLDLGAYGMRLWIGPCENGFPGPAAAAVDGPGWRMEIQRTLLLTAYLVIDEVSNGSKVYDFEWPNQYLRFFCGRFSWNYITSGCKRGNVNCRYKYQMKQTTACTLCINWNLQHHRAVYLRQCGFLVV